MNNDQFDDLKQFISASISQSEERICKEMTDGFKAVRREIQVVRQEMADGFLGVGEAIDEIHRQIEEQRETTDARLTKLERQMAQ